MKDDYLAPQNIMLICQIDGRAGSLYELLGDFAKRKVQYDTYRITSSSYRLR